MDEGLSESDLRSHISSHEEEDNGPNDRRVRRERRAGPQAIVKVTICMIIVFVGGLDRRFLVLLCWGHSIAFNRTYSCDSANREGYDYVRTKIR